MREEVLNFKFKVSLGWIVLMILITIQSSLSGFKLPPLGLRLEDKLVHFLIFGILAWLIIRGMSKETSAWIQKRKIIISLIIAILFAISDEWHQSLTLKRDADLFDLLADTLGIISFVLLFLRKQKQGAFNWDSTLSENP